ncbi:MAG: tryptophan synthase subunit alpha, partial [Pseudomonadota bacterium]|nr:tryptophan synthase subunit alpha [Pseudomonadota bacterium]
MTQPDPIADTLRHAARAGAPALVGFLTAGFPDRESFVRQLAAIAAVADVVEIGVPFSDPMADGVTIQRSSRVALEQGVTLAWILETLAALPARPRAPLLLMSYLNPLLSYGFQRLPAAARAAGVSGFIVPDLPWEESAEFRTV